MGKRVSAIKIKVTVSFPVDLKDSKTVAEAVAKAEKLSADLTEAGALDVTLTSEFANVIVKE